MPVEQEPELVGFDANEALAVARERAGEDLLVCAEYTTGGFNLLFVADDVVAEYGDEDAVRAFGEEIHDYLHVDFQERRLFEELYPHVEETHAFVTHTDYGLVARVLADDEGLYLTLRPGADASEVVDAVVEVVDGSD